MTTHRLMKFSDIDDQSILVAIAHRQSYSSLGMQLFDLAGVMWENADYGLGLVGCDDYKVMEHSDYGKSPTLPFNLVKAKMRKLIKRGLVNGCACGCRGDFILTEKGNMELESYYMPPQKLSN